MLVLILMRRSNAMKEMFIAADDSRAQTGSLGNIECGEGDGRLRLTHEGALLGDATFHRCPAVAAASPRTDCSSWQPHRDRQPLQTRLSPSDANSRWRLPPLS